MPFFFPLYGKKKGENWRSPFLHDFFFLDGYLVFGLMTSWFAYSLVDTTCGYLSLQLLFKCRFAYCFVLFVC